MVTWRVAMQQIRDDQTCKKHDPDEVRLPITVTCVNHHGCNLSGGIDFRSGNGALDFSHVCI